VVRQNAGELHKKSGAELAPGSLRWKALALALLNVQALVDLPCGLTAIRVAQHDPGLRFAGTETQGVALG
jgi:hypothetical protein